MSINLVELLIFFKRVSFSKTKALTDKTGKKIKNSDNYENDRLANILGIIEENMFLDY